MSKAWNKNILIERISSLLSKKEQYTIDKQPVITSTRSVCTMFKSTSWIKSLKF